MRRALVAAWLLVAAATPASARMPCPQAVASNGSDPRLDAWRVELDASEPARRSAAEAQLRRALAPADVVAALAALNRWPPAPAVALERALLELPRLRAALLFAAVEGDDGAVQLLGATFEQRVGELAPWRPELETLRERTLPWSQPGWRALRRGAPRAPLSFVELEATLRAAGAFEQGVALFPGVLAGGVQAPLAEEVAADGWLEIELARQELVAVRGLVATWVVPIAMAEADAASDSERGEVELQQRRACETRWFCAALTRCRELPSGAAATAAGGLLLRLGLPWFGATSTNATFDDGLERAIDEWRGPSQQKQRTAAALPFPPPPLATRAALRARLAELLAQAPRTESTGNEARLAEWTASWRDLVDQAAGRERDDLLLCGEFADALRQSAATTVATDWRVVCERAAAEFWRLGRSERPGRGLIELPAGATAR